MQASSAALSSGHIVGGDTTEAARKACQHALQDMDASVLAFMSQMQQEPAATQFPISFFEGATKIQLYFERPQASSDTWAATQEVRLLSWDMRAFVPAAVASEANNLSICG